MNSVERVIATIRGGPVDRRVFAPILTLYGAKLTGCPLEKYYTDHREYVRGQDAVFDAFEPDLLFGSFCLAPIGGSFGGKVKFFAKDAPNLITPALSSPEQISGFRLPDMTENPAIEYILDGIRLLVDKYKHKTAIAGVALSPHDIAIMAMGVYGWIETVLTNEDAANHMLEIVTPFFVQWLNAMFESGVTIVFLPTVFFNPAFIPRELAVKYQTKSLKEAFSQLKGPVVLHDTGSTFTEFMDVLKDIPNVAGFAINNKEPLSNAREKIGNQMVLASGLDCYEIKKFKAVDVCQKTINMLDDRKSDRHFMVASSGADVSFDTPAENILAIKRTVEEYGGWK